MTDLTLITLQEYLEDLESRDTEEARNAVRAAFAKYHPEVMDPDLNRDDLGLPCFDTQSAVSLCLLMFVSYAVATVNFRAIAMGSYFWLGVSDVALTFLGWSIFKKIAEAKHISEKIGYVLGGVLGGQAALWISMHMLMTK
jgi:hypothetical protein